MSVKAVREFNGMQLLAKAMNEHLPVSEKIDFKACQVSERMMSKSNPENQFPWEKLAADHPWLKTEKLVAKPDQLIKRRGKLGLITVNKDFEQVKEWVSERLGKEVNVEGVTGPLTNFIINPFCAHTQEQEMYVCIQSQRYHDEIYFYHEGGVDVGDVDAKALKLMIPTDGVIDANEVQEKLLINVAAKDKDKVRRFIVALHTVFVSCHFAYLEINPIVVLDDKIVPLDLAAKIDETAHFLCSGMWGDMDFPPGFGRAELPEEKKIKDMDAKTGASLKLTILNEMGRVWTMVAGGGASVVYADTVCDYGYGHELANYGEYSGAPSAEETFEYASTLFKLMTKYERDEGKVLIIGGGIANFTDVALTFAGLIKALKAYADDLKAHNVSIWVRRAGPNYQEGLRKIKACGDELGLEMKVYGPETHSTSVIAMALDQCEVIAEPDLDADPTKPQVSVKPATRARAGSDVMAGAMSPSRMASAERGGVMSPTERHKHHNPDAQFPKRRRSVSEHPNFSPATRCIVYGLQQRAVQGMLDFDYISKRGKPSVAAMVYPFSGNHQVKFYWGTDEILVPVYTSIAEAYEKCPDVECMVNFASFRSAFDTTLDCIRNAPTIKTIAIIAEGVPERQSRLILKEAEDRGVCIIGPATVGGIKAGVFRIGNTGGMLDNIVMSRLYRPGSVAYVSKSGGMSNELNNMIARNSDGVYEGVAIGGDRYPGTRFIDHMLRYEQNPEIKLLMLLGEIGGVDEYELINAVKEGIITKPIVAWCVGTCASQFSFDVQFGHAGAQARGDMETAVAKNAAMKEAGIIVPDSFDKMPEVLRETYEKLVRSGVIREKVEPAIPKVPLDYTWAKKLGIVRKPANFLSSISDERGDELHYAGVKISEVLSSDMGIGGVIGLLWFKQRLPDYCCHFLDKVLMLTADHGPAVSGAHNTIVSARAGKDLVSSLTSGLLTIGPRFGGALDDAAVMFARAAGVIPPNGEDGPCSPKEFVSNMKKRGQLIMGIGHRVKSVTNPDKRVTLVKEYALEHFNDNSVLNYALEVEKITTAKKANLILNVDGAIACCFVDMMRSCGNITDDEVAEQLEHGALNGLFVLGRSIGFIGHFIDQKRLKQPLYRHPWDDITFLGNS
eukprot:gene203-652_t